MATQHEDFGTKPPLAPAKSETPPPNPLPSSTTAAAEEIKVRPAPKTEAEQKAAVARAAPLQKQYDEVLGQIRTSVDPVARAALVVRKGHLTREIDAIKRPARIP